MWQKYLLLEKLIVGLFIHLFIHSFAIYSSFDTEVVIYNMMCADRAFVMAIKLNNIKEKHINLNVEYYIQFIHADINKIKLTFILYVVM